MLVDGAGQLKMTKDGKVLLSEMQIQVRYSFPPFATGSQWAEVEMEQQESDVVVCFAT